MKFSFYKFPHPPNKAFPNKHYILAPVITVRIWNPENRKRCVEVMALIDSGSEISVFPGRFVSDLNFNTTTDRILPLVGILDRTPKKVYIHDILLEIGGWKFPTISGFVYHDIAFPVLGREGFFNLFDIKFSLQKEVIEIKPKVDPLQR